MRKIVRIINKIANYFGAFILGCMMFMIVADIFLRNAFSFVIPGTFELTQVFLCMVVFFSAAYAQDRKDHVVIEFVYDLMPRAGKWVVSLISSLIFLGICIVMTKYIYDFAVYQISRGNFTSTLEIPLFYFSFVATFGMALLCLAVFCDLIFIIKDREVLSIDAS